jgi:uncharacterized protein (DUF2236 family)
MESHFDVRDMIYGAALLASTANVVMQLARPAVGYGVLESTVESEHMMRHPFRRTRNTVTYLAVAFMGTDEERSFCRRQVNRSHARVRSDADSPVRYHAFDPRLQLWVAACLYRDYLDRLMTLDYLPRPFSMAFGPVNRFLTVGFLPPPFREQMQVCWTDRDQHAFTFLVGMIALVNRLLPGPVSRFPFNFYLQDLRIRRFIGAKCGIGGAAGPD